MAVSANSRGLTVSIHLREAPVAPALSLAGLGGLLGGVIQAVLCSDCPSVKVAPAAVYALPRRMTRLVIKLTCPECVGDSHTPDAVDEIGHVSLGKLDSALQVLEPDAAVALHILCHGSAHDGGFSLAWNAEGIGGGARVSAYALRETLVAHAGKLAMVTLCTCGGADAGELDRALGSVAQEAHRLGVPWAVGARYRLSTRGSIVFAREFYDRLFADETNVERAYAGARRVLFQDTERRDWLGLQLYARDEHRGRQMGGSGGPARRLELPDDAQASDKPEDRTSTLRFRFDSESKPPVKMSRQTSPGSRAGEGVSCGELSGQRRLFARQP